jgi:UDP:flavonoid glycosyltransferase YjiC (YdhE family)
MICLLPHCAYLSETSRMLEIHAALADRGVRVRVATHGGPHVRLLDEAGIPYDVLGPGLDRERSAAFVSSGIGLGPPAQSMYTDAEIRMYVEAEAAYFREHKITVAVTGFTLTTLLSTRLTGTTLVTEHAGSFVPPVVDRSPYVGARRPELRLAYTGGFNRVAEELGVPSIPSLDALLLGDLSLVPEVPEVLGVSAEEIAAWSAVGRQEFRPESRLACTGPLYARLNTPLPERVSRFLDRPGKIVYVALTSTTAASVRDVINAMDQVGARVLVAGTVHDLDDLSSDRVMIEGVLPSHLIMPRVDLALTTGGQGSVQCAMATGTPLLAIPLHAEQELNVGLVEHLGAARRVSRADAGTPTIAAVADEMLADSSYGDHARAIQKIYDTVDGAGNAADAIIARQGQFDGSTPSSLA